MTALALAGIGIYATPTETQPVQPGAEPASPIRLTSWQARNMAIELSGDGGLSGQEIDDLVALPARTMPLSYLLATWLLKGDGDIAASARGVMGSRDMSHPEQTVFPGVVVVLFASDAARHTDATGMSAPAARAAAYRPRPTSAPGLDAEGPCSAAAGWLDSIITGLFDALKSSSDAWYAQLWNLGLDIFQGLLRGAIDAATTALLGSIKTFIGFISVAVMAFSLLTTWSMTVVPVPPANAFPVGGPPNTGKVIALLDTAGQEPWPGWVVDCAGSIGLDLPMAAAADAPLTWVTRKTPRQDLVTVTSPLQEPIGDDQRADLSYETGVDESDEGEPVTGFFQVKASIKRLDVTRLQEYLGRLLNIVPGVVGSVVNPYLNGLIQPRIDELTALADIRGEETVEITFREPPRPTPTFPTPLPSASDACPASPIEPGRYTGPFSETLIARTTLPVGGATGDLTATSTGTLDLTVSCDAGVTGTVTIPESTLVSTGSAGGTTVTVTCSTPNQRWTVTGGTVSQGSSGLPDFDLTTRSAPSTTTCQSNVFNIPGGDNPALSGRLLMRTTAAQGSTLIGLGAGTFESDLLRESIDRLIAKGATVDYTVTANWALNLQ